MNNVLSEADQLPVPNFGDSVKEFVNRWKLNGFIITGGNDLFAVPVRDETELYIIDFSAKNNLPLLFICRGLQVICHCFGYKIEQCPVPNEHVARMHVVNLVDCPVQEYRNEVLVNLFHDYCVGSKDNFSDVLKLFALAGTAYLKRYIQKLIELWV